MTIEVTFVHGCLTVYVIRFAIQFVITCCITLAVTCAVTRDYVCTWILECMRTSHLRLQYPLHLAVRVQSGVSSDL